MAFLTAPDPAATLGKPDAQIEEIAGCLRCATAWVKSEASDRVHLLQALPAPDDRQIIDACERAGLVRIGGLMYLSGRVPNGDSELPDGTPVLGERPAPLAPDFTIRTVHEGDAGFEGDRRHLMLALDRSYQQTLDCPELCGLRDTADVLESHRATGVFDPTLWFLAFRGDDPVGCALYARSRTGRSIELVYLGLSPEVRGRGLAAHLLWRGLRMARDRSVKEVACAVDERNTPAIRLYGRAGMREVARRVALVTGTR